MVLLQTLKYCVITVWRYHFSSNAIRVNGHPFLPVMRILGLLALSGISRGMFSAGSCFLCTCGAPVLWWRCTPSNDTSLCLEEALLLPQTKCATVFNILLFVTPKMQGFCSWSRCVGGKLPGSKKILASGCRGTRFVTAVSGQVNQPAFLLQTAKTATNNN